MSDLPPTVMDEMNRIEQAGDEIAARIGRGVDFVTAHPDHAKARQALEALVQQLNALAQLWADVRDRKVVASQVSGDDWTAGE